MTTYTESRSGRYVARNDDIHPDRPLSVPPGKVRSQTLFEDRLHIALPPFKRVQLDVPCACKLVTDKRDGGGLEAGLDVADVDERRRGGGYGEEDILFDCCGQDGLDC